MKSSQYMNIQNDLNIITDLLMQNFTREDWEKVKNEFSGQCNIDFNDLQFIKKNIDDADLLEYTELLLNRKKGINHKKKLINTIWRSAAVLIILASSVIIFQRLTDSKTNKELFEENYEFCSSDVIVRGDEQDDKKIQASDYYNNKDFKKALSLFKEQYKNNTEDHYSLLYIGLTYIECGLQAKNETEVIENFNNAIKNFMCLKETQDELFYDQALWYLALSYLYINDKKNAIYYFNEIIHSNCVFSDKASGIIDQLKK